MGSRRRSARATNARFASHDAGLRAPGRERHRLVPLASIFGRFLPCRAPATGLNADTRRARPPMMSHDDSTMPRYAISINTCAAGRERPLVLVTHALIVRITYRHAVASHSFAMTARGTRCRYEVSALRPIAYSYRPLPPQNAH
jgi:hypothetical protein